MPSAASTGRDADPFDLRRFVAAQEPVFDQAFAELRHGRKETHWMWFIFPQFAGLGFSLTSRNFAIRSRLEAQHYLDHPLLGSRLRECNEVLLSIHGRSAHDIFGSPDDLKLRSSMTLFAAVAGEESVYQGVLERYFAGVADARTLELLGSAGNDPA